MTALVAVATGMVTPLLAESVVNKAIAQYDKALLIPLGLDAAAFGVAQATLNFVRRWATATAVTGMESSMRGDLHTHMLCLDIGFHDAWQSGQLLSRVTSDLAAIRRFVGFGVVFLISNVVTFVAVLVLLIHLNWWLGLVTGAVFLPVIALCHRFEQRYRVLSRQAQDQQGDLATYVSEATTGIHVLKALGRRGEAAQRHREQAARVYRTQVSKANLRGNFWALLDLAPNVVIGLILILGAVAVSRHAISLGGMVAFIALTLQLVWPIGAMGYILATGQEAATAAQRVFEILDTNPAITGPEAESPGVAWPRGAPAGSLTFDHVSFCYPGAAEPLLTNITLDVKPGQTLALVGSNGAGKTVLLGLVPRLADVTSGVIRLDGTDVRSLPLPYLRTQVACVFEDATLFSASVRENVQFGAANAGEAEVRWALAAAQADFVHDLPQGLDTQIGEHGIALSGGQRQRIALARAILARPAVLLLDDPLSALDLHTEARATAALAEVLAGTTAILVAHRPSTVALADAVALLEGGVIAALGTHQELLATEPCYRLLMSPRADTSPR